jgi:hypothetical protein
MMYQLVEQFHRNEGLHRRRLGRKFELLYLLREVTSLDFQSAQEKRGYVDHNLFSRHYLNFRIRESCGHPET